MVKKTTDRKSGVELHRTHSKLGHIVTWSVFKLNDKQSPMAYIGIVTQVNNPFFVKNVGHQVFRLKFWLGFSFKGKKPEYFVAKSREGVVSQLVRYYNDSLTS